MNLEIKSLIGDRMAQRHGGVALVNPARLAFRECRRGSAVGGQLARGEMRRARGRPDRARFKILLTAANPRGGPSSCSAHTRARGGPGRGHMLRSKDLERTELTAQRIAEVHLYRTSTLIPMECARVLATRSARAALDAPSQRAAFFRSKVVRVMANCI